MATVTIEDNTRQYFTNIRTFSAQTEEASIPPASAFIDLDWAGPLPNEVEVRFGSLTTTGSPATIYFNVWRMLGTTIDRLISYQVPSSEFTATIPVNVKFDGSKIYCTVQFSGGTETIQDNPSRYFGAIVIEQLTNTSYATRPSNKVPLCELTLNSSGITGISDVRLYAAIQRFQSDLQTWYNGIFFAGF